MIPHIVSALVRLRIRDGLIRSANTDSATAVAKERIQRAYDEFQRAMIPQGYACEGHVPLMTCMGSVPEAEAELLPPPRPKKSPSPFRARLAAPKRFRVGIRRRRLSRQGLSRQRSLAPASRSAEPAFLARLRKIQSARLSFHAVSATVEFKARAEASAASPAEAIALASGPVAAQARLSAELFARMGFSCEPSAPDFKAEPVAPPAPPSPPETDRREAPKTDRRDPAAQAEFPIDDRHGPRRSADASEPQPPSDAASGSGSASA